MPLRSIASQCAAGSERCPHAHHAGVLTGRAENRIVLRSTQCERLSSVLVRQS